MSDDSPTATDSDDKTAAVSSDGGTDTTYTLGSYDVRTVLDYLALAGLVLFALVSAVQLYSAVGNIIREWITPEYRVFFSGAFNLIVLLLCIGGISKLLERVQ